MVRQTLRDALNRHKADVVNTLSEVTDRIYDSGDYDAIDKFGEFVAELSEVASNGTLVDRLSGLSESVEGRTNPGQDNGVFVSRKYAVGLMQEADRIAKKNPVTMFAYTKRIRVAARMGQVEVRRNKYGEITHVNRDDFFQLLKYKFDVDIDSISENGQTQLVADGDLRLLTPRRNSRFPEVLRLAGRQDITIDRALEILGVAGKEAAGYKSAYTRYYKSKLGTYISLSDAKEMWMEAEVKSPITMEIPTIGAYGHRILDRIKNGQIRSEGERRKTKVRKSDLKKAIKDRFKKLTTVSKKESKVNHFPEFLRLVNEKHFDLEGALDNLGITDTRVRSGIKGAYGRWHK